MRPQGLGRRAAGIGACATKLLKRFQLNNCGNIPACPAAALRATAAPKGGQSKQPLGRWPSAPRYDGSPPCRFTAGARTLSPVVRAAMAHPPFVHWGWVVLHAALAAAVLDALFAASSACSRSSECYVCLLGPASNKSERWTRCNGRAAAHPPLLTRLPRQAAQELPAPRRVFMVNMYDIFEGYLAVMRRVDELTAEEALRRHRQQLQGGAA